MKLSLYELYFFDKHLYCKDIFFNEELFGLLDNDK